MNYVLWFLPEVETDVRNGRLRYEEKSLGLGEEFLRVFYACSQELTRNPTIHQKVYREFQRCLLRRFPCAIYFRIEEDRVIVFGLFHCARDPQAPQGIGRARAVIRRRVSSVHALSYRYLSRNAFVFRMPSSSLWVLPSNRCRCTPYIRRPSPGQSVSCSP